jgi:AcrR family transcriptional regulator
MENAARSKRTRDAAIQAALTIIARDGASRLTIDAIARESGISKGGVLHQFRTKLDVLRALLDREREFYEGLYATHLARFSAERSAPNLATEIEISRAFLHDPNSATFAILGALAEDPELLADVREHARERVDQMKAEAKNPDIALLRWAAARGLALMALLRFDPLSEQERERLFARLLDDTQWQG